MYDNDQVMVEMDQLYGSHLSDSHKAMSMGPLLVLVAISGLLWNEGNAVKMHHSLEEALVLEEAFAGQLH